MDTETIFASGLLLLLFPPDWRLYILLDHLLHRSNCKFKIRELARTHLRQQVERGMNQKIFHVWIHLLAMGGFALYTEGGPPMG